MKRNLLNISVLGVLFLMFGLTIVTWAQPDDSSPPPPPPMTDMENKDAREILQTLRIWKMIKEVGLSEEQGTKIFPKVNELEKAFQQFKQSQGELIKQLRQLAEKNEVSEKDILAAIKRVRENQDNFRKSLTKTEDEILGSLTPQQKAKFIVFQEEFPDKMKNYLRELRDRGPRDGMKRRHGAAPAENSDQEP